MNIEAFRNAEDLVTAYEEILDVLSEIRKQLKKAKTGREKARLRKILEAGVAEADRIHQEAGPDFVEIEDTTHLISERHRLLIVINMMYNYWQRNQINNKDRYVHINRLGFSQKLEANNIGLYCAEAGCESQPRSVVLKNLQSLQIEARRYYKNHPEERAEIEYKPQALVNIVLPPHGKRDRMRKVK